MSKTRNKKQNNIPFLGKMSKVLVIMSISLVIAVMSCSKDDDNPNAGLTLGDVSILAGSDEQGFADGTGTTAKFYQPRGLVVDVQGNVYVADTGNNRIRKITSAGVVTTLAGNTEGFVDGNGANAQFYFPAGVTVDSQGNTYIADTRNHRIRKITSNGTVSTFAGSTQGNADGLGGVAQFSSPVGIAIGPQGNIYVSDSGSSRIRKISPSGEVTTLAKNDNDVHIFEGPVGITVDTQGNVYVVDIDLNKIVKITPNGEVSTLAGSEDGEYGDADGIGTEARFDTPFGIAVDSQGNVYIADSENFKIRKITPNGLVSTLLGDKSSVELVYPQGIAVDSQNNVYVADRVKIIKITQK